MDVTPVRLLDRSDGSLPIPGPSDPGHLESTVAAADVSLREEEIERLTDAGNRVSRRTGRRSGERDP